MKVAVVYGTMHKGSTYNIVNKIIEEMKIQTEVNVTSFSLPKDMPYFCNSCFNCLLKGEDKCPHFTTMQPIVKVLDEVDLIILASPVYVLDVSGQMKAFLDHLAYRWMPHRPEKKMFNKIGLVVSTAAGAGIRPTLATRSLFGIMKMSQKSNTWNLRDRNYWEAQGWLGNEKPF